MAFRMWAALPHGLAEPAELDDKRSVLGVNSNKLQAREVAHSGMTVTTKNG